MKIFVCIKQVPDTETKIKLNSSKTGIDENGVKWIMNPFDEYAVEEALKLKTTEAGSTVTVVSLGPKKRCVDSIRTALAMGADDGILIDCENETDGATTAEALATAIKAEDSFDMIFTGMAAIDKNAALCSQQLAERLKVPHTTVVNKFEYNSGVTTVERAIEGGSTEIVELKGPAVIGATKGLNTPRYASLPGIMKAKKKPLKELSFNDMNLSDKNRISYSNYEMPPEKPPVKMIDGDVAQQANKLATLLKEEAKVL